MPETIHALLIVGGGVAALLLLVIGLRIHAFISLLLVSLGVALVAGLPGHEVITSIRTGMGGTLGFVAVVVGLGAMFGALLEVSGSIERLSTALLRTSGLKGAPWLLGILGFLISIPVFFDVAIILMAPLLYGLARKTGKPLLYFAIPLFTGFAVTHAFIPPTPGPIAVADLLNADLASVILMGLVVGLPTMIIAGPLLAPWIVKLAGPESNIELHLIDTAEPARKIEHSSSLVVAGIVGLILVPLCLILMGATAEYWVGEGAGQDALEFLGHPFVALLIACILAYVILGRAQGISKERLNEVLGRSLEPAGVVVLITGAGGVFKQVLIDTQLGEQMAVAISAAQFSPLVFAFIVTTIVRVAQGSATVAMITGAGLTAPILQAASLSDTQVALVVVAIASGATMLSHVNDSGFWMVCRYLGITESQNLRAWTVASTVIGVVGFTLALLLSMFV